MRAFQTALLIIMYMWVFIVAHAQSRTFTKDDLEYVIDLPSPSWQVVSRVDVHGHFEFVNGTDPSNGYLHIRKILQVAASTPSDLFRRAETWELRSLPGYIACSECEGEKLEGHLKGAVFTYEYVSEGKSMCGRIYYLQLDSHTFYALRFTVNADKAHAVRDQMDNIARSFRIKNGS